MVHRLDRDVGRIVELLRELKLAENTLIVFTSDNGGHKFNGPRFQSSGPLRGYKRDLTEGGIRVPFIACWPGNIAEGQTSSEVIAFEDLLPTFCELASADSPDHVDGISIVDALRGNKLTTTRPYRYWDYGHNRPRYDQAVRMGNWKGIRLGAGTPLQLYDLSVDLGETNDIAPEHPEVVRKIEDIMRTAVIPNRRYEIGERYRGSPIWKRH